MSSRIEELVRDLDSEVEDVRKAAVVWLSQLHDPAVLPRLARLAEDPSPAIRYFARHAVDELRARPTVERIPNDLPTILALLTAPEREKKVAAGMACYSRRDPNLLPHLVKALEGETDLHVIATLVKAIGAQRDPRVIPQLVHLLHHTDSRVRSNTVDAAMLMDDAEMLDAVGVLASDANGRVRSSVALYLAQRDPARVPDIVREMVESDLIWMKDAAVYVMHAVGAAWCLPIMEQLMQRPNEHPALLRKLGVAHAHLKQKLAGEEALLQSLSGSAVSMDSKLIEQLRAEAAAAEKEAQAASGAPQMDEQTRLLLVRLGTQAFKSSRIGELPEKELAAQAEKVAALGATLDRGQRLAQTLAQRDVELVTLGQMVLAAGKEGKLENEALAREAMRVWASMEPRAAPAEAPPAGESTEPAEHIEGSAIRRRTIKEQAVSPDNSKAPGRPTMHERALSDPNKPSKSVKPPEPPPVPWYVRNRGLVLPTVLLITVVAAVGLAVLLRSDSVIVRALPIAQKPVDKKQLFLTLEDVLAEKDKSAYKGHIVRWQGKVKEGLGAGTMRLVVAVGKKEFSAEFSTPITAEIFEDIAVTVDGKIEYVTGDKVHLKGIRATTYSTGFERAAAKRKKEYEARKKKRF